MLDHSTRISDRDHIRRDVLGNHRPGTDSNVIPYRDPRKNGHASSDPDIVTDSHRLRPLPARVSFDRISAMAGRIYADIGTNKTIITDCHPGLIKNRKMEIGKETLSNTNLLAIVTVKRLIYDNIIIPHSPQQPLQHLQTPTNISRRQQIILMNHRLHSIQLIKQLLIHCRINHSCKHLLFLCHN